MMSVPPTKKTAPKKGSISVVQMACADHSSSCVAPIATKMASRIVNRLRQQAVLPPKPPRRLVNVEAAADYAGISRRTMYHWIKDKLVVTGHWPRTNRRYVDLDSVDTLLAKSDE